MAKYKDLFVKGCKETNDIEAKEAKKVWSAIEKFADYGFNKSHALAYAILTYWHAYLKAYYPLEYMSALLSIQINNADKIQKYIQEATRLELIVLPPDINTSGRQFTSTNEDEIIFGIGALAGIGPQAVEAILEAREVKKFSNILDFMERIDTRRLNIGGIRVLIQVGAFDSMGYDREYLIEALPVLQKYFKDKDLYYDNVIRKELRDEEIGEWEVKFAAWSADKKAKKVTKLPEAILHPVLKRKVYWDPPRPKKPTTIKAKSKPDLPILQDLLYRDEKGKHMPRITLQMVKWEAQLAKVFISGHPLDFFELPSHVKTHTFQMIDDGMHNHGTAIASVISIETKKIKSGKNRGKKMAYIGLQDRTGYAQMVVFARQYEGQEFQDLEIGDTILISYKLNTIGDETILKISAKSIRRIG